MLLLSNGWKLGDWDSSCNEDISPPIQNNTIPVITDGSAAVLPDLVVFHLAAGKRSFRSGNKIHND